MRKILLLVLLALVLAEIGMRIAGRLYLKELYADLEARPGELNIVCLGESSTQGLGLDFQDSYPKQLERSLRGHFQTDAIRMIVPPHVGQNTSQIANRVEDYLQRYSPKLLIVMTGVNNEWALGESHITPFLDGSTSSPAEIREVQRLIWLDQIRLFKVVRYVYLRFAADAPPAKSYLWGHPQYYQYPPPAELYAFARANLTAFTKLWEHDLRIILDAARRAKVPVVLMTYHIHPSHLEPSILNRLASEYDATVVRNDQLFAKSIQDGSIEQYLLEDKWHLNAEGYRIIANNLLLEILEHRLLIP